MPTKTTSTIERAFSGESTPVYSDTYLQRLDCLKRCILAVQAAEDDLRDHAFDRGAARAACGLLLLARRALCEHLQGELQQGGAR
ncbi:hypothetical protein [Methylohalobius crimeensis]|uniref:hypothetical protein n=1 Tax=Methylohalobius crimeensis TaxID=244365 RepID=UPI001267F3F0|nr:hypothetical protein [Methylohalobius crimeensis]